MIELDIDAQEVQEIRERQKIITQEKECKGHRNLECEIQRLAKELDINSFFQKGPTKDAPIDRGRGAEYNLVQIYFIDEIINEVNQILKDFGHDYQVDEKDKLFDENFKTYFAPHYRKCFHNIASFQDLKLDESTKAKENIGRKKAIDLYCEKKDRHKVKRRTKNFVDALSRVYGYALTYREHRAEINRWRAEEEKIHHKDIGLKNIIKTFLYFSQFGKALDKIKWLESERADPQKVNKELGIGRYQTTVLVNELRKKESKKSKKDIGFEQAIQTYISMLEKSPKN